MLIINDAGLELIKSFEKCKLHVYKDQAGLATIGWGHLLSSSEFEMTEITQEQADAFLLKDLSSSEQAVDGSITVPLNSNQASSLISFQFNTGVIDSDPPITLVRRLNAGEYFAVPSEMRKWCHIHDPVTHLLVVSEGLKNRREKEIALWLEPVS